MFNNVPDEVVSPLFIGSEYQPSSFDTEYGISENTCDKYVTKCYKILDMAL